MRANPIPGGLIRSGPVAVCNSALRRLPAWLVWTAGMTPLALLVLDMVQGGLGVDPLRAIEHRTGRTAIYFLVATLCVTPLLRLVRINLIRFRRILGLLSFVYAALHVLAWAVLDHGLVWPRILYEILHRPYVTIGTVSAAILLILAATATEPAIRRLGPRRWRWIHRGIYVAAPFSCWHWLLSAKVAGLWAWVVLLVVGVLLGWRLWVLVRGRWGLF